MEREESFLRQLREVFALEAEEHLATLLQFVMALERSGTMDDRGELQKAYRAAHSLKGAARAVDLSDIESLCHGMENVLAPLYRGEKNFDPAIVASIAASVEKLEKLVKDGRDTTRTPEPAKEQAAAEIPAAIPQSTTKIRTERLEKILADAEELIPLKLALGERLSELKKLAQSSGEAAKVARRVEEDFRRLETLSDRLLSNAYHALIMPSSYLTSGLARMARDLARELGKEVDLIVDDDGLEFEKSILEGLKDPVVHLIRNAVDHGIELPEARIRAGKPRRGTIRLSIHSLAGGEAELTLSDDGPGIDPELMERIFLPGFSTRSVVTGVSGRGMGLAIVKEGVENLGGSVQVESTKGRGTTFRLKAPSARVTFEGVVVRISGRNFIIPATAMIAAIRVPQDSVSRSHNAESALFDGRQLDLLHLGDLLGIPRILNPTTSGHFLAAIVDSGGTRKAFVVDEILGTHEVLVKPLGSLMPRVKGILGVAVLGSGEIVPVLYPRDIVHGTMSRGAGLAPEAGPAAAPSASGAPGGKPKSVLVVEDSITSRMLLKSILESAGYVVAVANDGIEGLTALKMGAFDAVVSDIEMPRMDGIALTAAIRSEPRFAHLPVILVTSLEQREHRERGVAAGANAYISKNDFAQSNLLETMARFI